MALFNAWPIWAEQQQLNSWKKSTQLLFSAMIKNIINKAWNKNKKAESGVLYRGKPDKKGK